MQDFIRTNKSEQSFQRYFYISWETHFMRGYGEFNKSGYASKIYHRFKCDFMIRPTFEITGGKYIKTKISSLLNELYSLI